MTCQFVTSDNKNSCFDFKPNSKERPELATFSDTERTLKLESVNIRPGKDRQDLKLTLNLSLYKPV